jgi:hypothetical protein
VGSMATRLVPRDFVREVLARYCGRGRTADPDRTDGPRHDAENAPGRPALTTARHTSRVRDARVGVSATPVTPRRHPTLERRPCRLAHRLERPV